MVGYCHILHERPLNKERSDLLWTVQLFFRKKLNILKQRNYEICHHTDDGYNGNNVPDDLVAPLAARGVGHLSII